MLKKIFLAALIGYSVALFGGIEEFFKPALNKGQSSSLSNIDFIYMINLDPRPEKFAYCIDQLAPFNIVPYRFSAVNGWELSNETLDHLGVSYQSGMTQGLWGTYFVANSDKHEVMHQFGRTYFCHGMTKGAIGIVMSHLSVLQDAYDAGYETIWVMEDDVQVIRNPHLLGEYIVKLDALVGKGQWDILFTDRDTKGQDGKYVICRSYAPRPNFTPADPAKFARKPELAGTDFTRVFARYGAYSMIVRRSGMKKILDFFKTYKVYLPYDMDYYLPEGINLFAVTRDIVSTKPDALSDNGKPAYVNK